MRTRADVEQDMLDTLADEHRCDRANDPAGVALCCDRLEQLQLEWAHTPLTVPDQRPSSG